MFSKFKTEVMSFIGSGSSQLKQQLKNNSTLVHEGPPEIYQIHTQNTSISGDIRKCQLGTAECGSTEKVIMMVGATGSGKTTMIDAMFNHVVGVKCEDPFRFRLVDESVQAKTSTQADSQTNGITAYTLYYQEGFAVPYTLTIVDTPGFGDTRGKEHDKKLIEQIRLLFTTTGEAGIDHIDAVAFVVKANDARLTENQQYIFDSVLSLWGKNIKGNIFMVFSFADDEKPNAHAALKEAKIPYEKEKCYEFNNAKLFSDKKSGYLAGVYWQINRQSFDKFLTEHLTMVKPKSLTLSEVVLDGRRMLEICQEGNKEDIQNIVFTQEQLNNQIILLNKHKKDLEENKKFTYTEDIKENVEVPLDHIIMGAINCSKCKRTCHYPCMAIMPYACYVFTWGGECTVCFCSFRNHNFQNYRYQLQTKTITRTDEDLKKKYSDTEGRMVNASEMVVMAEQQLKAIEKKIVGMLMVQRLITETLQEIALQPANKRVGWTERDYIEHMIQAEKRERKERWIERTQQLEKIQQNSGELSREWNTVYNRIQPNYRADPELSTEDNTKRRKWQKNMQFKQNVLFSVSISKL